MEHKCLWCNRPNARWWVLIRFSLYTAPHWRAFCAECAEMPNVRAVMLRRVPLIQGCPADV